MPQGQAGNFARFQQFADSVPDAFVAVGPSGDIVLVNAQTETLFGYARDELVGRPIEELVPDRLRGAHVGHRDGYFARPSTRPMGAGLDLFGRRRDGSEFPAEISLSTVDLGEGPLAIAAIRDVTERVQAERERLDLENELEARRRGELERERAELEEQVNQLRRLESIGQLAGGIAHDFNNVLGVILNYAQFVAEDIGEDSPAYADVEEIRRAAERAAALTRQLLIFSRREVVHTQILDLNEVITDLEKLLGRALGEHIRLEKQLEGELWPIEADPGQVEQVLVNLAVNARDAMPSGGRLRIETGNVDLSEERAGMHTVARPGPHVALSVSDDGAGMDPDVAERAFEPFFTTKPKGEGTGLGLSTVYGIVSEAGGAINLYSEPGMGTTVRVHLPATERAPGTVKTRRAAPETGQGERVLLVEDEDPVRRLTERILAANGYEVVSAPSGAAALERLSDGDGPFDLLLTDVVMPGILGPELADEATALRPELHVLFMSGYVHQMIERLESDREGFAFVEKPFGADDLLLGVRRALDGDPG